MNRTARSVMRKLGQDQALDQERERVLEQIDGDAKSSETKSPSKELMSETERRHERYRRRQAEASKLGPAAERLPIMTPEERERREKLKVNRRVIQFEGPIEKLIEKYKDPEEVFKHLSLGQLMKYELKDGKIYEKGELIYDGATFKKRPA